MSDSADTEYTVWQQPEPEPVALTRREAIGGMVGVIATGITDPNLPGYVPSGPLKPVSWDPDNHIYIEAATSSVLDGVTQINGISRDPQYNPPPNGWFCITVQDADWGWSSLCAYQGTWAMRNGDRWATLTLYGYDPAVVPNYSSLALTVDGGSNSVSSAAVGNLTFQHIGTVGINNVLWINSVNSDLVFAVGAAGQQPNWRIQAQTGHLAPGPSNTIDIGFSAGNHLRNVFASGALKTGGKAGAAIDGDVNAPTDGMLRYDSTNNRLYIRIGGTWRYATLT